MQAWTGATVHSTRQHWRACVVGKGDGKLGHDGGGSSDKVMMVLYHWDGDMTSPPLSTNQRKEKPGAVADRWAPQICYFSNFNK
jgi:hypothetical protein